MDEAKKLRDAINRQTKPDEVVRLDNTIQQLMDNWISPQQSLFDSIERLWRQLLPAELSKHCRIGNISGGQLTVLVDSPSYMYELKLCSCELVSELQRRCRGARIKEIKLILA